MEVEEFLEHYGVRGMRWGVRRHLQNLPPGQARADYLTGKDAKWRAKVEANPKLKKMARIAARDSKKQIRKLKQEYKSLGHDVKRNGLHQTRYDNEVAQILQHSVERAAHKVHGRSGSGLLQVRVHRHPTGDVSAFIDFIDHNPKIAKQLQKIHKSDLKKERAAAHADSNALTAEDFSTPLEFRLVLDSEGFVDDIITPYPEDLQQDGLSYSEEFLEHHGIRGMHWGIRRSKAELSRGSSGKSSGKPPWQSAPVRKPSTAGHTPQHDQAIYEGLKARAKLHGIHSLSNEEIRILTNRAETLKKAYAAFPKKQTKSQKLGKRAGKIIDNVLLNTGEALLKDVIKNKATIKLQDAGHLPRKDTAAERLKKAGFTVADN